MGDDGVHAPRHSYGGQAVMEGVMMRGRDVWAVAVRRPNSSLHIESHHIDSVARRFRVLRQPFFRGVIALGQSLSIGVKALAVSATQSSPEEAHLSSRQIAASMVVAIAVFVGVFIVGPAVAFRWLGHSVDSSFLANVLEGLFRVALFLAYLTLIGRNRDVRRVFQYHGAEHKTIAAFEHQDALTTENVDRHSTLHVRCGTNFLLIVMVVAILVFALFGSPGLWWRVGSRIVGIPIIAGLAYELLRAGAKYEHRPFMRALMAPGLWLQKITTKTPDRDQLQVAIASFNEVRRAESQLPAAEA